VLDATVYARVFACSCVTGDYTRDLT